MPHAAADCFLPRRPNLVAAATNTGAVLLSFDTNERPPVVALPAQVGRTATGLAALPLPCLLAPTLRSDAAGALLQQHTPGAVQLSTLRCSEWVSWLLTAPAVFPARW